MWNGYLSLRRTAKAQASLLIRAVSPELPLLAHTRYGTRYESHIWSYYEPVPAKPDGAEGPIHVTRLSMNPLLKLSRTRSVSKRPGFESGLMELQRSKQYCTTQESVVSTLPNAQYDKYSVKDDIVWCRTTEPETWSRINLILYILSPWTFWMRPACYNRYMDVFFFSIITKMAMAGCKFKEHLIYGVFET